ncbi:GAF and ANTAR domain-containing protein [Amycolatopsis suaedae]|nr:GAF and ANTAR domain-containing protein [Amycolatopsis suaedae]
MTTGSDEHVGFSFGDEFTRLTATVLGATNVGDVLQRVVDATVRLIPEADIVSITLREDRGRFHTPVETSPEATKLDMIQYDTGEGPCVEAARPEGTTIAASADVAADPRWPRFGKAAAELGVGSVVAAALLPGPGSPRLSGALNVYSRRVNGLDSLDRDAILLLATHASLAVAETQAVTMADLQAAQLREAIDSRDVIGQAKGILMSRRGVSADEAFDILRRASQELNVKLVTLAETLTERHGELELP